MKKQEEQEPQAQQDGMQQAFLAIAEALKTIKSGDAGAADKLASIEQFLIAQEAHNPKENLFNPPMMSDFNPLGERDHPRPDLKCRMVWVGYKLSKDCCTREEIDLLNRIEPGDYRVTKSNGRKIPFRVTPRWSDNGTLESMSFHFPCKATEDRQDHMPMTSYLKEVLGEAPTFDMLQAEIASLKAQLDIRKSAG